MLPLPVDVGEALADYVRYGRPRCATRRLFVILHVPSPVWSRKAPSSRWSSGPASGWYRRVRTHRLRHALACDLLRHGASLAEVGQVLRHSDERTTAIYAKVDQDALGDLARSCPAGAAL